MLFKKDELKILWPFYLDILVYGLSTMIMPFIALYYLSLGFSYFQISVITSAFAVAMVLFEIPTGALADGFSRKYSVILGLLISAISVFIIPLTINFYLITVLWAIAGIGQTFMSGALDAWVIDNLNKERRIDLQHEYFLKTSSFSSFGAVFAPLLGAILVGLYSIRILWFVYAIGFFSSAMVLFFFTKEYFTPKKIILMEAVKKTLYTSKLGVAFSVRNKTFFFSIIAGLFTVVLIRFGYIGKNPFLLSLGMQENQIGYLYCIVAGAGMIVPFLSRLTIRENQKNVMSIILLIAIVMHLSLAFVNAPYFVIACFVVGIIDILIALIFPISQAYLHKIIPSKIRATTMSTKSMGDQLIFALSTLVSGFFLDLYGPQKVLVASGLFGILAIYFYQRIRD